MSVASFPRTPIRRWEIVQMASGFWRGELFDGDIRVGRTQEGPLHSVRWTVQEHRQGLPMVTRRLSPRGVRS